MFDFLVLLLLSSVFVACESHKFVDLRDAEFDATLTEKKGLWLVLFRRTWHEQCTKFVATDPNIPKEIDHVGKIAELNYFTSPVLNARFGRSRTCELYVVDSTKQPFTFWRYQEEPTLRGMQGWLSGEWAKRAGEKPLPAADDVTPAVDPQGSTEITTANATQFRKGRWMLMGYAPWCGYCQKAMPDWEGMSWEIKEINEKVMKGKEDGRFGPVNVVKYDATEDINKDLNTWLEIPGFPSIYYIHDGVVKRWDGDYDFKGFMKFATYGNMKAKPMEVSAPPDEFGVLMNRARKNYKMFWRDNQALWEDADGKWRKYVYAAFLAGLIVGWQVMKFLCCCCCGARKAKQS
eukprot:TRINITY_DN31862_c0_g1_i1.p1 TRINITY_DN31862_c0_g1~~TRINITY_DN31862_c0_g1_i1.p1  ORF type:complete len:356 (+),score=38.34 TRINITY_DN31862_c0_g1_i1:27-1070(+)